MSWNDCPVCGKELILLPHQRWLQCISEHYSVYISTNTYSCDYFTIGKFRIRRSSYFDIDINLNAKAAPHEWNPFIDASFPFEKFNSEEKINKLLMLI